MGIFDFILNNKKIVYTVLILLIIGGGGLYYLNRQASEALKKKIALYENRAKEYPDDLDNYKKLSELYETLGRLDISETYYKYSQNLIRANKEKDKKKRGIYYKQNQKLLKKLIDNKKAPVAISSSPKNNLTEENLKAKKITKKVDLPLNQDLSHYQSALKLIKGNQLRLAENKLLESLLTKPKHAPSLSLLAEVYQKLGDDIKAEEFAQKAINNSDKESQAYEILGNIANKTKDYKMAENNYLKAISADKNNYQAHFKLGIIKHRKKQLNDAIYHYKQSLFAKPDFYKAQYNMALAYKTMKKDYKSRQILENTVKLQSLRQDEKMYAKVSALLGENYYNEKKYSLALKYYKNSVDKVENYKIIYNIGLTYEALEKKEEAEVYYLECRRLNKRYFPAIYNLGVVCLDQKKYQQAFNFFVEANKIKPDNLKSLLNQGKSLLYLNRSDDAFQIFNQVLAMAPDSPTANIEVARYWKIIGDWDKSIKYAEKALKSESNERDKIIYFNEIASINKKRNLFDLAKKNYQQALTINPSDTTTLFNLADMQIEQNQYQLALENYQKILSIDPGHYEIYKYIGKVYIELLENEKAKEAFETLLKKSPNYTDKDEIEKYLERLK